MSILNELENVMKVNNEILKAKKKNMKSLPGWHGLHSQHAGGAGISEEDEDNYDNYNKWAKKKERRVKEKYEMIKHKWNLMSKEQRMKFIMMVSVGNKSYSERISNLEYDDFDAIDIKALSHRIPLQVYDLKKLDIDYEEYMKDITKEKTYGHIKK